MGRMASVILVLAAVVSAGRLPADEPTPQADQAARWAHLAARADAAARLVRQVGNLKITAQTTVADVAAASETVAAVLRALAAGAPDKGEPRVMGDGSCEVFMEIGLDEVAAALRHVLAAGAAGGVVQAGDLEKLAEVNSVKVLGAAGIGAPLPELLCPAAVPVRGGDYAGDSKLTGPARALWKKLPRGRLEAVQAARMDARRRLGDRVKVVHLGADLTVGDLVAEAGRRGVRVDRFLRGARETAVCYHEDILVVEVRMSLSLRKVYMDLKGWAQGDLPAGRERLRLLEELIVKSKDTLIPAAGVATPPAKYVPGAGAGFGALAALVAEAPPWFTQKLRATAGVAGGTEAARRMARLDARRELAARVEALRINSRTVVRDLAAGDEFRDALATFLQSARIVETAGEPAGRPASRPAGPVTMAVDLRPLWNLILHHSDRVPRGGKPVDGSP